MIFVLRLVRKGSIYDIALSPATLLTEIKHCFLRINQPWNHFSCSAGNRTDPTVMELEC